VQLLQQHGQQQPWQHQQQQQWQTLPPKGHSTGSLTAAEAPLPAGLVIVPLFTQQQLQGVLDAVQVVRFGQRVQLPGCFGVTAQARPSGSGIGSCMWLLSSGDQRYGNL
jgi:Cft2 family RNA processing exonuclease